MGFWGGGLSWKLLGGCLTFFFFFLFVSFGGDSVYEYVWMDAMDGCDGNRFTLGWIKREYSRDSRDSRDEFEDSSRDGFGLGLDLDRWDICICICMYTVYCILYCITVVTIVTIAKMILLL